MKSLKKFLCAVLVFAMIATSVVFTASAAGTVAYGAGTVSATTLNIRSGPGTNYSIVDTVKNGEIVVIIEKSTSEWYRINYDGTVGYVSSRYLKNVLTAENFDAEGTVNDTSVRYRTGPSTSHTSLGTIPKGTEVDIIGINNGWYKLTYNGTTGYMRSDYIDLGGAAAEDKDDEKEEDTTTETTPEDTTTSTETAVNKKGSVTGNYVRFRSAPSLTSAIIRLLNKGAAVDVVAEVDGWYKITYGGKTGYMSSDYITLSSDTTSSETTKPETSTPSTSEPDVEAMDEVGYVTGNYVRMRKGASTTDAIITLLNKGASVSITGKTGNWYQIKYNGNVGYMSADYITIGEAPAVSDSYELGKQIAEYTLQFNGSRYVYGGSSPATGFDCSGLMYYVYGQFGYSIQRRASMQYAYNGVHVSRSELQPGDLVFFAGDGYENGVTHVGMYIGDNKFIHASTSSTGIIISSLGTSFYDDNLYGAKRIV
ncbi:MAG: SH3 domain-containing protein [Oscillospiraceae bacterium]|nr:SH3 domain-containing protein [Oscillospiraceae bacterium]